MTSRLALLACCVALFGGRVRASGTSVPAVDREFRHTKHVSHFWTDEFDPKKAKGNPEYARDCRGCHDYTQARPRDPQSVCNNCHLDVQVGGFEVATKPGHEDGFRRNPSSLYSHTDHLSLACRQCHAPTPGDRDDYAGSVGIGACTACHASANPPKLEMVMVDQGGQGGLATLKNANWQQGFFAALNANPRFRSDDRFGFLHRDHVARADLGSKEACSQCHAGVENSTTDDVSRQPFSNTTCGSCHTGGKGVPVDVGVLNVMSSCTLLAIPSPSARTFSHSDHLKPALSRDVQADCAGTVFKTIASDGCLACHVHDDSGPKPTFVLREKRADYAGCMTCHDVERFKAKEHGQWDTCVACHAIGAGDMKSQRRLVAIDRAAAGSVRFEMPPRQHPGLVDGPAQACAECHRAKIPAVRTARRSAKFDHDAHVPKQATSADCAKCHDEISTKGTVDGIANVGVPWTEDSPSNVDPARVLTFDVAACGTCHPGITLDLDSLSARTPVTVPAFSHKGHLEAAHFPDRQGPLVTCTTCHTLDSAERGKPVGTLSAAQDCTLCHSHEDGRAAWTGNVRASEVKSCQVCHAGRMPTPGTRPSVEKGSAYLSGRQVHAAGQACTECHRSTGETETLARPDIVVATGERANRHASNDSRPADCFACHWGVVNLSISADVPDVDKRALLGWNMACFPGGAFGHPGASGNCPEQPR